MDFFSFYSIKWVRTVEFPKIEVPLMYFDGMPAVGVNQWLSKKFSGSVSPSKLEECLRAIGHLYNFQKALSVIEGDEYQPHLLLKKFIDAKLSGTDKFCTLSEDSYLKHIYLGWKPVNASNIKATYLNHINDFDKFQATFHNAERLNPSELEFLSDYEKYLEFKNRTKWDALLHLFPSHQGAKEVFEANVDSKSRAARRRAKQLKKRMNKCFPPSRFIELIEALGNPRDKLLFLIYGGGSLRKSEPLHTFFDDVKGADINGMLKIQLDDPEFGEYTWADTDGNLHTTTRKEYFDRCFVNEHLPEFHPLRNLQPRNLVLRRSNGLHSGFKGMEFLDASATAHESSTQLGEMFWISPEIGRYAVKVYQEYLEEYIYFNPKTKAPNPKGFPWHPWLFIKIDHQGYGMPLTISAVNETMKRILKKMEINVKGLGIHSLRHLFGFYCANVLNIPIERLQGMIHHGNISSTQIYYHLSEEKVRHELLLAYKKASANGDDIKLPSVTNFNHAFSFKYPKHWTI